MVLGNCMFDYLLLGMRILYIEYGCPDLTRHHRAISIYSIISRHLLSGTLESKRRSNNGGSEPNAGKADARLR